MILVALSIALMVLDHRYQHVDQLRAGLSVIVLPVQYAVNIPAEVADWFSDTFKYRSTLMEENTTLKTKNHLLKAQLQKFVAMEAENIRLRELLQSSKKAGEKVLVAEVIAVDLDPYKRQIKLNKGSNNDVYKGQPLVDAQGIMGQIVHVDPVSSIAMLITDPSHNLPIQVIRNGLRAIAVGTGANGLLELPYQPNNVDIKPDDLLVTSGLGDVFPSGYPSAKVIAVDIDPSLPFATITAIPTANLDRGREVLLVWPPRRIAPTSQTKTKGSAS